jgi:hypothetical protein
MDLASATRSETLDKAVPYSEEICIIGLTLIFFYVFCACASA